MIARLPISRLKLRSRKPTSVLGLSLEGSRLEGVWLRRSNGSLSVQKAFTAALALNPLNSDPTLVGREIRNHLEQAGIRERRCVLCLPLSWALTLHLPLPDLPDSDLASFLEIEAERGFPYGPDALALASSRTEPHPGGRHASLLAVPRNHIKQLEAALKAAQLRPASFSLGIATLQPPDHSASQGVLALAVGENTIDLQVTCHHGVVALRSLEDAIEIQGAQKQLHPDILAREIRVTLGQLPAPLRDAVSKVRVFGQSELLPAFVRDLQARIQSMGLQVEWIQSCSADGFRSKPPPGTPLTPAFSLAARYLTGDLSPFEFLPPKIGPLRQFASRFSSRKLGWTGAAAALVAILVGGAVLLQQGQLAVLRSRWAAIVPNVRKIEAMQQQIRRFRPWFDESFRSLGILRSLTEAFPAEGLVTAKSLEIRELSLVSCSGIARDNRAFLKMLETLNASKQVANVQVDQVRGKTPLQFTLNFQWNPGDPGEP